MNMQTEYANTHIIMRGYEIANYVTHVKNPKLHLHKFKRITLTTFQINEAF